MCFHGEAISERGHESREENVSPIRSDTICGEGGTIEGRGQDTFAGTAISCDRGDEKTFSSSNFGEDGTEKVRARLVFALVMLRCSLVLVYITNRLTLPAFLI
jgi:hypothetical protein